MKVHQIRWSRSEKNVLYFNTLSCFDCEMPQCNHYVLRKVDYSDVLEASSVVLPEEQSTAVEAVESNEENILPNPDRTLTNELVEDDWVVVRYKMEETKGERRWIGRILRVNENETFLVSFLRSRNTRQHSGFIYSYPDLYDQKGILIEDIATVCKTQILYSLPPPTKFQRAFKFNVHKDNL